MATGIGCVAASTKAVFFFFELHTLGRSGCAHSLRMSATCRKVLRLLSGIDNVVVFITPLTTRLH